MSTAQLLVHRVILLLGFALSVSCSPIAQEPATPSTCRLEKVGGEANACHCSHRIEP